ncbi:MULTISPECIES: Mor transcription activator family protein [Pseudomonadota]|jgi:Mor family transcriptional regulator|uniref:Mor transcription activator family protein n=1 Tax=Pseudomonadota TaxID=1224 RepID=UPI0003193556|nr:MULTISPECIES: Mor transcription activator family protein [Pseudomonadota]MPT02570.1 hypothetical protein [Pseudomonas sp.]MPT51334.1 hypothetical protein [Delftia sp.]SFB52007.1 Mor transcription activator family protein [Delftia tsuruhatensis]
MTTSIESVSPPEDSAAQLLECELLEIAEQELGLSGPQALCVAQAMLRGLRKRYGGMRMGARGAAIYVPAPSKKERNEAIRREFNGVNRQQLQTKYGLQRAQLYRILGERPGSVRNGISSPETSPSVEG